MLATPHTRLSPFSVQSMPRLFVLAVSSQGGKVLQRMMAKCLLLMRAPDALVIVHVADSLDEGNDDGRETGSSYSSHQGVDGFDSSLPLPPSLSASFDSPLLLPSPTDTSDAHSQAIVREAQHLLSVSHVRGAVRLVRRSPVRTIGRHVCAVVEEEKGDVLVVGRGKLRHVSEECLRAARCSIAMIDADHD